MRFKVALFILLLFPIAHVFAAQPGIDVEAIVERYSELKLTEEQTKILNEATKVSTACRVFYGLYGRWPNGLQEIKNRTSGIDFSVFGDKLFIKETAEGLVITVFDSRDVRQLLATSDASIPLKTQALAQDPDFRIRVGLRLSPDGI